MKHYLSYKNGVDIPQTVGTATNGPHAGRGFVAEGATRGRQLRRGVHQGGARADARAARRGPRHQPGACLGAVRAPRVPLGPLTRLYPQEEFRGFSFINGDFNPCPAPLP